MELSTSVVLPDGRLANMFQAGIDAGNRPTLGKRSYRFTAEGVSVKGETTRGTLKLLGLAMGSDSKLVLVTIHDLGTVADVPFPNASCSPYYVFKQSESGWDHLPNGLPLELRDAFDKGFDVRVSWSGDDSAKNLSAKYRQFDHSAIKPNCS